MGDRDGHEDLLPCVVRGASLLLRPVAKPRLCRRGPTTNATAGTTTACGRAGALSQSDGSLTSSAGVSRALDIEARLSSSRRDRPTRSVPPIPGGRHLLGWESLSALQPSAPDMVALDRTRQPKLWRTCSRRGAIGHARLNDDAPGGAFTRLCHRWGMGWIGHLCRRRLQCQCGPRRRRWKGQRADVAPGGPTRRAHVPGAQPAGWAPIRLVCTESTGTCERSGPAL